MQTEKHIDNSTEMQPNASKNIPLQEYLLIVGVKISQENYVSAKEGFEPYVPIGYIEWNGK